MTTCRTCRHFAPAEPLGTCRANPPQVSAIVEAVEGQPDRIVHATGWPSVLPDDWCGRWGAAGIETKVHPLDQGEL